MQKTMKKTLAIILAILMIVTTIPMAFAADVVASGNCGANGGNVKWTLDSDGTLTISGTGNMADIKYTDLSGLDYFSDKIKSILNNKANTSSLGSYYTKSQVDNLLSGKSDSGTGFYIPAGRSSASGSCTSMPDGS